MGNIFKACVNVFWEALRRHDSEGVFALH